MVRKIIGVAIVITAVLIALSIAVINFFKYKNEVERNDMKELIQVEDKIKSSLTTLDKAYSMFDQKTTEQMIEYSAKVVELYEQSEDYHEVDLDTLSKQFEMDVYLMNEDYEIVHSSEKRDLGLNFSKCCPKLIPLLEESREESKFISPGIDVEQTTGEVKKFSYEGTDDGKFVVELGYSLENDDVFDEFGFSDAINEIEKDYSAIESIRVLNIGGLPIGEEQEKLSPENREAFEQALQSKKQLKFQVYLTIKKQIIVILIMI